MTHQEKIAFKNRLKQFCHSAIEQRILAAKDAVANAQQSANSEEKSSAGDKYETGRAMGHLQKDMYARQLAEHVKELAALDSINCNVIYETVKEGSFINCNTVCFFIASGLGKQTIDSQLVLFLSAAAPLTKTLIGKRAGDSIQFNNKQEIIESVF